jgi:hypothetical protein
MKVLLGTNDKDLGRTAYLANNRPFVRRLALPILQGEKQRVHFASQFALSVLCCSIKIGVVQLVSNHHEIDVAVGCIGFLRNRSVDEGGLDPVGVWFEGLFDWLGQALYKPSVRVFCC